MEHTEYTERGTRGGSRGNGRGRSFFTTKDATGGGRDPEKLPANYAKGREWRRGDSEEWPTEHTEDTERRRAEGGREPQA